MLINSAFKDYYDNIMSTGVDRDCIYNRKTEAVEYRKTIYPHLYTEGDDRFNKYVFHPLIIGFCGKLYPVIRITKKELVSEKSNNTYIYNMNDFLEFMNINKIKKFKRINKYSIQAEKSIKNYFDKSYQKLEIVFREFNIPVFILGSDESITNYGYRPSILTINPRLKDFDFIRVKDPYTAYQEIFMYIAGVLGTPEKKMLSVSDKVKAQQYGHDGKYSFKKPPEN